MENIIALINQCSTDKEIADLLQEKIINGRYYLFIDKYAGFKRMSFFIASLQDDIKIINESKGHKRIEFINIYEGSHYAINFGDENLYVKNMKNNTFRINNKLLLLCEVSQNTYNKVVQEFERQAVFKAEFLPYLKP